MIDLSQFQDILADSLFAGNGTVAGLVIFAITLAVIFVVLNQNIFASLVIAIPVAFIYSLLGLLSTDMLLLLIVICVLGLATVGKKTLGERGCSAASWTRDSSSAA